MMGQQTAEFISWHIYTFMSLSSSVTSSVFVHDAEKDEGCHYCFFVAKIIGNVTKLRGKMYIYIFFSGIRITVDNYIRFFPLKLPNDVMSLRIRFNAF